MEIVAGQIVRSLAGHDKGEFFVIKSSDEKYVYLCDGKSRKLENPKKKKKIHIALTNKKVRQELTTNRQIIKALAIFKKEQISDQT